jgi:hypothetical protein
LNLGRRGGKPATNRLSYGAASYCQLLDNKSIQFIIYQVSFQWKTTKRMTNWCETNFQGRLLGISLSHLNVFSIESQAIVQHSSLAGHVINTPSGGLVTSRRFFVSEVRIVCELPLTELFRIQRELCVPSALT